MLCFKPLDLFQPLFILFLLFSVQKEVLKALKQAFLEKLSPCILGNLTDDREIAETVANLIKLSTDIKDFGNLISKLPSVLPSVDSFQR